MLPTEELLLLLLSRDFGFIQILCFLSRSGSAQITTSTEYSEFRRKYHNLNAGKKSSFFSRVGQTIKNVFLVLTRFLSKAFSTFLLMPYYAVCVVVGVARGAWRAVAGLHHRTTVGGEDLQYESDTDAPVVAAERARSDNFISKFLSKVMLVILFPYQLLVRGFKVVQSGYISVVFWLFLFSRKVCIAVADKIKTVLWFPYHLWKHFLGIVKNLIHEAEEFPPSEYEQMQEEFLLQQQSQDGQHPTGTSHKTFIERSRAGLHCVFHSIVAAATWILKKVMLIPHVCVILPGTLLYAKIEALLRRKPDDGLLKRPHTRSQTKRYKDRGDKQGQEEEVFEVAHDKQKQNKLLSWLKGKLYSASNKLQALVCYIARSFVSFVQLVFHAVTHVIFWPVYSILGIAWLLSLPFVLLYRGVTELTSKRNQKASLSTVKEAKDLQEEDIVLLEEKFERLHLQPSFCEKICFFILRVLYVPVWLAKTLLYVLASPFIALHSYISSWRNKTDDFEEERVGRSQHESRRTTRSMAHEEHEETITKVAEEEQSSTNNFWQDLTRVFIHILLIPWYVILGILSMVVAPVLIIVEWLRSWQQDEKTQKHEQKTFTGMSRNMYQLFARPFTLGWMKVASGFERGHTEEKHHEEVDVAQLKSGTVRTYTSKKTTTIVTERATGQKPDAKTVQQKSIFGRILEVLYHVLMSPVYLLAAFYTCLLWIFHKISVCDVWILSQLTLIGNKILNVSWYVWYLPRNLYSRLFSSKKKAEVDESSWVGKKTVTTSSSSTTVTRSFLGIRGGVHSKMGGITTRVVSIVSIVVKTVGYGLYSLSVVPYLWVSQSISEVTRKIVSPFQNLLEKVQHLDLWILSRTAFLSVLLLPLRLLPPLLLTSWRCLERTALACWSTTLWCTSSLLSILTRPATWVHKASTSTHGQQEGTSMFFWLYQLVIRIFERVFLLDAWLLSRYVISWRTELGINV